MYKGIRSQYLHDTVNINSYNFISFLKRLLSLVLLCEGSEDGEHRGAKRVKDSAARTAINFVNTISLRVNARMCPRNGMSNTSWFDMR